MITGLVLVGVLLSREAVRATGWGGRAVGVGLDRALGPVAVGFAMVVLIRLADLVASGG